MARPPKYEDPTKLNLYVEKTTVEKARKIAAQGRKSISDLFSAFIESLPNPK